MREPWTSPRHRVLKADIVVSDTDETLGCEVHNVCRSGATLRLPQASALPPTFDLRLPGSVELACSVIRRSRIEVGVRFAG